MSAWRISSCCTFIGAPVSSRRLRKVWRNVCQPIWPMPHRTAAGAICRCCTLQGCHGNVPALKGLANIQSSGLLNCVARCQFKSASASKGSSGMPAREYSVLTSLTRFTATDLISTNSKVRAPSRRQHLSRFASRSSTRTVRRTRSQTRTTRPRGDAAELRTSENICDCSTITAKPEVIPSSVGYQYRQTRLCPTTSAADWRPLHMTIRTVYVER
jgi:hypothetical protein